MVGNRKPLLRSLLSGNDTHGRYMSGTPMKSICGIARGADLGARIEHDAARP